SRIALAIFVFQAARDSHASRVAYRKNCKRSIRRTRNSGGILPLVYPAGSVSEPKPLGHQCERPPGVFAGAPLRLPNRNTPTSALDNGAIDCSSRNQLHSVSHKTIRGI